jgi:hypothetical protein
VPGTETLEPEIGADAGFLTRFGFELVLVLEFEADFFAGTAETTADPEVVEGVNSGIGVAFAEVDAEPAAEADADSSSLCA